ncbi:MAG: precorrin-8X methylmutase [Vallitaleaceae bacterium]|nr:precorrin-8X methylmutase [Vallitaleaceae bacterium]
MHPYIEDPFEIERKSFEIIHEEMKNTQLEPVRLQVMKRVIHTTTDFIFEDILWFKDGIEQQLMAALKEGCTIVTDTEMIKAGISKKLLETFGAKVECYVAHPRAHEIAGVQGITRSMAAVDLALEQPGKKIFVIGNAPTALYRIMEKVEAGEKDIVGVVGVPVGFVGAQESKDALWETDIPCMITKGRKGGSTVAVAIMNALLREAVKTLE